MKKKAYFLFSVLMLLALTLSACAAPQALPQATEAPAAQQPAMAATEGQPAAPANAAATAEQQPAAAATEQQPAASGSEPVTLEYWVFSDYATDVGGDLQKQFISEFEASHPGVKINMTGKGGDELNTAVVSSAASGSIPDIFMNSTSNGALFTKVNALANVYDKWMSEPESYRKQFNPDMLAELSPADKTMWGLPYTGYATFLYRNLDVLQKAGIDPKEEVTDWNAWLAQMKKIKDAGLLALPSFYYDWWDFTSIYSGAATSDEWGIDFTNKTTKINPDKYIQTVKFLEEAKQYGTDLALQDQATTDLFLSNKLAFVISGPWSNPTFLEAKKNSGLNYDYVLIPGATPDNKGGVRGTEYIGFAPNNKNFDVAWEFVKYIMDEPQMTRWAEALARYNSNEVVLSKVSDPLLQITTDAAKSALLERPPHFVEAYPGNYYQELQDNLAQITTGKFTPEEGAKDLVEKLNAIIAGE
jgi:multiple sugar transport system substrate-binding protein